MKYSTPKTFALIALVAIAVAHPLCAHSLVLCVGSDGHVELEPSVDGNCADARSAKAQASEFQQATVGTGFEDHCGECVDLPMVHSAPEIYSVGYTVRVPAPSAAMLAPVTLGLDQELLVPTVETISADSATFRASLRSVSLRI